MSAMFTLYRHEDISGVSGTGVVCEGVEFSDGAVAVRWLGDHPSTTAWKDIRDMEAIHGHSGATEVLYSEPARLLAAYQRVIPWLLSARYADRPVTCAPHPDHPDRLLLGFKTEKAWRMWVALLDGSTYAATHEEVDGEIRTTWISPDGGLWLQYRTPGTFTELLEGETYTPGTAWDKHDDPEENR
jgi:hypothetical protein